MKHFSIAEWTDYVRGVTGSATASQMKAHLESGCQQCGKTAHTLEKLVAVLAADTSRDVPDYVMHNAKALFALQQPEKVTLPSMIAQLVFDSFRQPQMAGVRSQERLSRHAIYEAGDFCVNLRLDREHSGGRVNLVGQVDHRMRRGSATANLPVSLMAGHQIIARTISNQFGEFHFEYLPAEQLRLHVPVDVQGKSIEVRLYELSADDPIDDDIYGDGDGKPHSDGTEQ